MKSFILSTLLMRLAFGRSGEGAADIQRENSKLNCERVGCNYCPEEQKTKLVRCREDGSQLSVIFNGDNGCSDWNEFIATSSINNGCCPKAMEPKLEYPKQEGLIVGGTSVKASAYPFIAYLSTNDITGDTDDCTGSIIRKEKPAMILTAAHCVFEDFARGITIDTDSDDTFVRLNANTMSDDKIFSWIERFVVHEKYNGEPGDGNDLAILKLSTDISTYPDSQVAAVTINRISSGTECCNHGDDLQVIGYGTVSEKGESSATLEFADVNYISRASCNTSPDYDYSDGEITTNEICAAGPGRDHCYGDSGGPLIKKGTTEQVGVVSFSGGSCADPRKPGVYVDLGVYYDWIAVTKAALMA